MLASLFVGGVTRFALEDYFLDYVSTLTLPIQKISGAGERLKLNNRLIFQTTVLGFVMIASNIAGLGVAGNIPQVLPETNIQNIASVKVNRTEEENKKNIERSITVEEYIRNYFSDIPIMVEIARCESRFRQHDHKGDILRGEVNNLDRGVMQINEYYHIDDSAKLGYDILTIEGNTAYARHLFEKYGVKPWSSSAPCWSKTTAYSEYKELALR